MYTLCKMFNLRGQWRHGFFLKIPTRPVTRNTPTQLNFRTSWFLSCSLRLATPQPISLVTYLYSNLTVRNAILNTVFTLLETIRPIGTIIIWSPMFLSCEVHKKENNTRLRFSNNTLDDVAHKFGTVWLIEF